MERVLITGGAGFLGSSLAEALLDSEKYEVVIVDNLSTGSAVKIPVHPLCRFINCDVNRYNDVAPVVTSLRFDYVFHYAAVVGVERTLKNPVKVLEDIHGIQNLLKLCKNTGVKRFFFTSSSEVYGEPVEFPQNEHTTPLNSRLPYAIVKNVGEAFCRSYQKEYGLPYTIFRFFNTYGPKQSSDFVISKFLKAALSNSPITIFGDGSQSRTFLYVTDNVTAIVNTLQNNECVNDVVNIGGEIDITVNELVNKILQVTNTKSEVIHLPPLSEGDMTRRKPDTNKMKRLLLSTPVSLDEGLKLILRSKYFYELNGIVK